jgi:hypothetical protein
MTRHRSLEVLLFALVLAVATSSAATCPCDCNRDCEVTIDELITTLDVALEVTPLSACPASDLDGNLHPTIDEVISCVNAALLGCDCAHSPLCFDGVVDRGEDCDDGGTCVGGSNAGSHCTSASDCLGDGLCDDGPRFGSGCATDTDCPDGSCTRCKTFGGDGCAANCTNETTVDVPLVTGGVSGNDVFPGTSGAVINGDILTVPVPLAGSLRLTVGKLSSNGTVPFVLRAADADLPLVQIPSLLDICLRAVALQTCGGTLFAPDGTPSPSCTPNFDGQVDCPTTQPCAFVHGPANAATGIVACRDSGLTDIDVTLRRDAGGATNTAGPLQIQGGGSGPQGSVYAMGSFAMAFVDGPAACSESAPSSGRGVPFTLPLTTGAAVATLTNYNGQDDSSLGPFTVHGAPVDCRLLTTIPPSLPGFSLVGATPILDQPTTGDVVLTIDFAAR